MAFPNTNVGGTSTAPAPAAATVTNLGNQSLIFSANPPYTGNFSQIISDSNPCTSSTTLTHDGSCNVPIQFSPQIAGSLSANVTVTDNNLNVPGSIQQIAASGTGVQTAHATTTAVFVLPASPVYGQAVTLTATVSSTSTPTGAVTFTDLTTSTTLAPNLTLIAGVATFTTSALALGSHTIQAVYTPAGNFLASSGTTTVTITNASTGLMLSGSPNPSIFGQSVTFTASVSSASGTPTGTLTFTDQTTSTTLASNANLSAGVASATAGTLAVGSHTIRAVYTPTGNFVTSSGTTTATVAKASTSTVVMFSGGTLTATVSVTIPGSGNPTGTVQFFNGSTLVGSAPLVQATASLNSSLINGLTAVYSGDANFNGSTSAPLGTSPTPNLTLSGSPNPSVFGQSVTFTVSVTAASSSGGTVQFSDGPALLGTAPLTGAQASLSTSSLAPGSHAIIATMAAPPRVGDRSCPPWRQRSR